MKNNPLGLFCFILKNMKAGIDYVGVTTPFYCHDGKGNFLFHKRSLNCRDEQGNWDPGSGQLEFGLSPEENVLKELQEEYSCKGKITGNIPAHTIFRKLSDGTKTHWIAIPFFIQVKPNDVVIGEPEKIDEICWAPLTELPIPLHAGFQYTFSNYKKYFDSYIKK